MDSPPLPLSAYGGSFARNPEFQGPAGPRWRWKLANRRPLLHGELNCSCRCSIAIGHFRVLFVVVLGRRAAPPANAQCPPLCLRIIISASSSSLFPLLLGARQPDSSCSDADAPSFKLARRLYCTQLTVPRGALAGMPSRSSISSSGSAPLSSVTADFVHESDSDILFGQPYEIYWFACTLCRGASRVGRANA